MPTFSLTHSRRSFTTIETWALITLRKFLWSKFLWTADNSMSSWKLSSYLEWTVANTISVSGFSESSTSCADGLQARWNTCFFICGRSRPVKRPTIRSISEQMLFSHASNLPSISDFQRWLPWNFAILSCFDTREPTLIRLASRS